MNPYHFVRLAPVVQRESVNGRGHDRFNGLSGRLLCRLTAETHLFVPGYRAGVAGRSLQHEQLRFCRDDQTPFIPGTSLKGMLRSVSEAVSGSCFIYEELSYERSSIQYDFLRNHGHCRNINELCPACRLFGFLNRDNVFSGLVSVSDARAEVDAFHADMLTLGVLSTPKPRHRAFYGQIGQPRQVRGRKFYYHHPPGRVVTRMQKDGQNKTVEAVKPGAVFTFSVDYVNLSEPDLALLLYAVALEPDLRHKIGMGKPVGLGSAHIEIVRWEALNHANRYRSLGSGWDAPLESDALIQALNDFLQRHSNTILQADLIADLRRVWHWPPHPNTTIRYPDQAWFKANPSTPLEQAP